MIPLTLAEEIRTTLLDYLTTTFNFQDAAVESALLEFLQHPQEGLFKGPYLHLRLPFRTVAPDATIPLNVRPTFTPYVHQLRAFERLSSHNDHIPEPTIITTGTGSGKTECFLYPILDYCYAHRGEPGIKAIILYPMNALASDQAARLAKILWGDPRLKNQVMAGMYIGGKGSENHRTLGPDFLIEDHETLRKHPPDILLTNFKMLDFLLLRPDDKTLWVDNHPDTMQYLVLDELHTYDGAQGSDVACLIRRLRERLHIPEGMLCPVGTSATVVSERGDTSDDLIRFAAQVFGVAFPSDSVIGETRVDLGDFLLDAPTLYSFPDDLDALEERPGERYSEYINRQAHLWFSEDLNAFSIVPALRQHTLLRTLLSTVRDEIVPWEELTKRVGRWDTSYAGLAPEQQRKVLQSFLALIAHAKVGSAENPRPFLTCQVQLWVREMSRLMREVNTEPRFFWRDDVPAQSTRRGLPAYYCHDCGHTGWLTLMHDGDDALNDNHRAIYEAYFDKHKNVHYVYPVAAVDPSRLLSTTERVCPQCLGVSNEEECRACGVSTIPVKLYHEVGAPTGNQPPRDLQRCPMCGTDNALSIVGSQAASLSSVAISHLYTSPLNDDKKLLAFTDSVQDASHRASFFGSRTYRFNLRTAFQAALPENAPIRLDQLSAMIVKYWRERWSDLPNREQRLAATFMPPDLREVSSYEEFMQGNPGPMPAHLENDLFKRLSWEVMMEYGFTARIGRSLEKVGSSTAYLDPAKVGIAVEHLMLILREEIGLLKDISSDSVRHFVVGLLERTRTRGGVVHPLLKHYAEEQGNWFLLTKKRQPLLSPFHKHSPRFPKFLTDSSNRDVFDLYLTSGLRNTWYVDWARRTLSGDLGVADINEVYRLTMPRLTEEDILHRYTHGNANAYGLRPEVLLVTRQTASVRCTDCGHEQTVTESTRADWVDHVCLNYQCSGRYGTDTRPTQHYYRAVYDRGEVERVFPHEHTGLLDRDVREQVEKGFKEQNRADAPNLLAATSTLELGIDIGYLSATMACSVPPATANYLQRIGRAGRKTGTSLILTMANAQPHDLYFFQEPREMIAGVIVPPGCFIDAPDMLKRQFLAYCMDTWTAEDERARLLPHNVQRMLAEYKRGGFPVPLLEFYERNKQRLIDRFLALFGSEISELNKPRMREFAAGSELPDRVRKAIADIEAEREDLRNARRAFKERRDRIEADPAQYEKPSEEIARLDREMALLVKLIRDLEEKYILNFFTDAGLLPNYAFPETGVKFKAIITGTEPTHEGEPSDKTREYVRAAPLAIRELAPFNTFYAEGRKLLVDHIETGGQEKAIEKWQFCDQCSHMELVQAHHFHSACPRCGSVRWNDVGQKHDMILFRHASAWVDHNESLVGDDDDDRERKTYQIGSLFDIPPQTANVGYVLPALPFGIEYHDKVTLREVNFGPTDTPGQKINVAGAEFSENGFHICQDCGLTVTAPESTPNISAKHTRNCLSRSTNRQPEWHNLYLYRTITSEALRILLPVSTTLVDEKIATFEACLDLGLRRWFRGDPEHLQILTHTEPALDGTRRRFLIIYDTIPGGTSYLRELARPENFLRVLRLALDTLISCRCRLDPEKKACYRCLYSYRSQRALELISRRLGIEMLSEILEQWPSLQSAASLSDTPIHSLIESELEQRLIDALRKYAEKNKHDGCSWRPTIYNGKRSWELRLGNRTWLIEPQVMLDGAHRVRIASKADFVFWPQGSASQNLLPVAVFTDGFAYHVRPGESQGNLADDLSKRRALSESGRFLVWSITWDDVKEFEEDAPFPLRLFAAAQRHLDRVAHDSRTPLSSHLMRENAVNQFLEYLKLPDWSVWSQTIYRLLIGSFMPFRPAIDSRVVNELTQLLRTQLVIPALSIPEDVEVGQQAYGILQSRFNSLLMHTPQASLRDAAALSLTLRLDDTFKNRSELEFRQDWRQFLVLCNLYQFLPGFVPVTTEAIEQFGGQARTPELVSTGAPAVSEQWANVFEFASPACVDLLNACMASSAPAPAVGYELMGNDGRITAAAELAWEEQQVAVLLSKEEPDWAHFVQSGWKIFLPNDCEQVLTSLARAE